MLFLSKKEALKLCEDQGEAWIRARVKIDGVDANIDMLAWLEAKEMERERQVYEEQKEAQSRTIKAAEKSAAFSMWSSIIALVTVIVTVVIFLNTVKI